MEGKKVRSVKSPRKLTQMNTEFLGSREGASADPSQPSPILPLGATLSLPICPFTAF
jgi:hypothetical protein